MTDRQKPEQKEIFIKKHIAELTSGDIILHPIFRSDGLMLIKQYKILTNDLALKVKQLVPGKFPVLVLSPNCDMETFDKFQYYNNKALIKELEKVCNKYGEYMQVPLEIGAFADNRTIINDDKKPVYDIYRKENPYIDFLYKSPFYSTFENKLESPHLQTRAKKIKEILVDKLLQNKSLLDKLNELKNYKDIILLHSINTTSISLMFGLTLEMPETDLLDLAIANLLIDISVTQIPKEQFELHLMGKKPNTDFYNLHLMQLKILSQNLPLIRKESIIYGILDQYEHYNGTGYPKGKKESEISLFGRIISIAQAYDEMVGGYFYNNGIKPIQAMQNIWEMRSTKFDPDIIRIFIDRTTLLKLGQDIIVNNFYKGTIMGFTDFINHPISPILKLENGDVVNLLEYKK